MSKSEDSNRIALRERVIHVEGESAPERSKGLLDAAHPAGPSSAL